MNRFNALSAARRSSRFFSFEDYLQRGGANCPPPFFRKRKHQRIGACYERLFGDRESGIANKSHVSRLFSIFLANDSLISVCRGTASIVPVFGLIHGACEAPSRFKEHPAMRSKRSKSFRFIRPILFRV